MSCNPGTGAPGTGDADRTPRPPKPPTGPALRTIGRLHERDVAQFGREIELLRAALEQTRRERDVLASVLDQLPMGIFWKDTAGRYVGCNARFLRDLGVGTADDVLGLTDFDLPTPATDPLAIQCDEIDVISTGLPAPLSIETEVLDGGKLSRIVTRRVPWLDREGHALGVIGIRDRDQDREQGSSPAIAG